MSKDHFAKNDPERTLITLDQLSQTIEVMTGVVNRLRKHLCEQLEEAHRRDSSGGSEDEDELDGVDWPRQSARLRRPADDADPAAGYDGLELDIMGIDDESLDLDSADMLALDDRDCRDDLDLASESAEWNEICSVWLPKFKRVLH